jgi:2-dehydro-3-deoxyphosphooctonate aldolase (KDO 8-P synthase)
MAIRIGGADTHQVVVGGERLPVISGPCAIESRDSVLFHARALKEIAERAGVSLIFKSSYDKANRTSLSSFRGVGLEEGLRILSEVRSEFGLPVITDVHSAEEVKTVAPVVDLLQIPAFLCRQTDLLVAAGQAGKPVMIKKGQFMHPEDMRFAAQKVGGDSVLLCERGTCFGYRELVVDFRSFSWMREVAPVIFDATHSVQSMGGASGRSSGDRRFVRGLARAAVAYGVDGVFLESHESPDSAPSDGPNMIPLGELESLLNELVRLHKSC